MGGTAMGHRPSAFRAFLLAPIAFAISPSLAHAHGDVTSNADSLRVLLSEWSLEIDAIRVGAGIVRVRAVNVGTLRHNLTVTKAGTFSEIYQRSEEGRVGKECVNTYRSRRSQYH